MGEGVSVASTRDVSVASTGMISVFFAGRVSVWGNSVIESSEPAGNTAHALKRVVKTNRIKRKVKYFSILWVAEG